VETLGERRFWVQETRRAGSVTTRWRHDDIARDAGDDDVAYSCLQCSTAVILDPFGRLVTAIDVHAHFLSGDIDDPSGNAPRLVVDSTGEGRIVEGVGGSGGRPVPPTMWSIEQRLALMDGGGVSHQVISPVPAVMTYAWGTDPAYARSVNASIAAACERSGGRLIGLGCVPAIAWREEVDRCVALGLRGLEVGTRLGDCDLDSPQLDELWRSCEDNDLCLFVHPVDGGRGVLRRPGPLIDAGLGMLTDTALAASAMVFGGVLAARPGLRIALAHGCGTFLWAYPRLRYLSDPGESGNGWDNLVRRLYADTLVFSGEHLRLLAQQLGPDRLVLGSDSPYLPDQLAGLVDSVDVAVGAGAIDSTMRVNVLVGNALRLLGLTDWMDGTLP